MRSVSEPDLASAFESAKRPARISKSVRSTSFTRCAGRSSRWPTWLSAMRPSSSMVITTRSVPAEPNGSWSQVGSLWLAAAIAFANALATLATPGTSPRVPGLSLAVCSAPGATAEAAPGGARAGSAALAAGAGFRARARGRFAMGTEPGSGPAAAAGARGAGAGAGGTGFRVSSSSSRSYVSPRKLAPASAGARVPARCTVKSSARPRTAA